MSRRAEDIRGVALLEDATRASLYAYVQRRGEPVGRDEAAKATGISRSLAAFHLDRLAQAGLLDVEYRRISGRTGRGAGRPAKLYRLSDRRLAVSIPETRYDLAGAVLVRAVAEGLREEPAREAVARSASHQGEELGRRLAGTVGEGPDLGRVERAMEELGFHPEREGDLIRPRNCPFHALVEENASLVCSLNEALIAGLVQGLGCTEVVAEVDPEPTACCIRVRAQRATGARL